MLCLIAILVTPVFWMKELDSSKIPQHNFKHFAHEIWLTMQNLTTLYLMINIVGISTLTNFVNNANIYVQYYIIELTNFQAGIDSVTTYAALSFAIWVYKVYFININWRYTSCGSVLISSAVGLVWILVYYDIFGLMNPWFTIFIDMDTVSMIYDDDEDYDGVCDDGDDHSCC
jgi:hypothetical protein